MPGEWITLRASSGVQIKYTSYNGLSEVKIKKFQCFNQ